MTLGPCSAISCSCSGAGLRSPAVPLVLFLCALYGLAVERFAVRPFASRGSDSWLMATVAIGIVVDNLVLFTFGKEPRGFPSPLAARPIQLAEGAGSIRFSS